MIKQKDSKCKTAAVLARLRFGDVVGAISCLGLLLLAFLIISPPVAEDASAEEAIIDEAAIGVDVNMESVVSIALENAAGIEITPKAESTFKSQDARLTITTNNIDGYRIFMSTIDNKPELSNVSVNTDKTIRSISGTSVLPSAFPDNTWGYSLNQGTVTAGGSTAYSAISGESTQIKNIAKGETTGKDTYTLSFGAKANAEIPAGRYSNQVVISAVANPIDINNLQHLTYMQDMTNAICANTKGTDGQTVTAAAHNEPSKQLIDIRDGNSYWVSKLADGNCWMVQNLDLNITQNMITSGSLNSGNTDLGYTGTGETATENGTVWSGNVSGISSTDGQANCGANSWMDAGKNSDSISRNCTVINGKARYTPAATMAVTEKNPMSGTLDTTNGGTKSWDFGEYVSSRPLWKANCQANIWMNCSQYGFYDVSDSKKWSPTYDSAADLQNYGKADVGYKAIRCTEGAEEFGSDGIMISWCTAGEYDPHYLIGNHYMHNASTAGSSGTLTNAEATNSICPKGWKLPASGGWINASTPNADADDSFSQLYSKYGFIYDKIGDYGNWYLGGSNPSSTGADVRLAPLYHVMNGEVNQANTLADLAGTHIASSTKIGDPGWIMYPLMNYNGVWPASTWITSIGMSIRCMAR